MRIDLRSIWRLLGLRIDVGRILDQLDETSRFWLDITTFTNYSYVNRNSQKATIDNDLRGKIHDEPHFQSRRD